MVKKVKECCANCHCLFHKLTNCQGLDDLENDKCHEFRVTLEGKLIYEDKE